MKWFRLKIILLSIGILIMTFVTCGMYIQVDIAKDEIFKSNITSNEAKSKTSTRKQLRESYVSGNYNNEFITGLKITRSEVACMIFEIENLEYGYDYVYSDTNENSYVGIISAVVKKRYMSPNTKGEFLPDNYLTRADFAKIICSIIKKNKQTNYREKIREYNNNLNDIENIDSKENIIKLYEYGIIDGNNDNNFRPLDFLTREEAIIIFNKIYGYDKGDYEHMLEVYNKDPYVNLDPYYWAFSDIVRATVGLEK